MILFVFSFSIYFIYDGYKMYKDVLEETPLNLKINELKEKENYTKLSDMNDIYLDAVISTEDNKFYKHNGINISSIVRAFIHDVQAKELVEGGSTITQQLSKNLYFTQEKTFKRKIAETFMAFNIEKHYSKNEILEFYLNTSYFGNGYYTVREASLGYFNKEPKDLSVSESIMLAGIPNAPSVYNPKENLKLAKERQKQVIDKMIENDKLTKKEAKKILSE